MADESTRPGPGPIRYGYGPDLSQFGDLYLPSDPPRGVVVVIHGGFWRSDYDLALGAPLAEDLVRRGFAVWNLEYRRVGDGGGIPPTHEDVADGIAAVRELTGGMGPVVALGHSAGGYLAVWAASRGLVAAAVSQCGVLDLQDAVRQGLGDGAVGRFVAGAAADSAVDLGLVGPRPDPTPVWCVHARDDEVVPLAQSQRYVERRREQGDPVELVQVDGGHHAVIDTGSPAWAASVAAVEKSVQATTPVAAE